MKSGKLERLIRVLCISFHFHVSLFIFLDEKTIETGERRKKRDPLQYSFVYPTLERGLQNGSSKLKKKKKSVDTGRPNLTSVNKIK
jgi:hypothetical protein